MKENRLERTMKQSLLKGLSQALQKAFNDSSVRVQVGKLYTRLLMDEIQRLNMLVGGIHFLNWLLNGLIKTWEPQSVR